jgi:hypothetical protein
MIRRPKSLACNVKSPYSLPAAMRGGKGGA